MNLTRRQRKRARSVARRLAAEYERELVLVLQRMPPRIVEEQAADLTERRRRARELKRAARAERT